MADDPYLWLEDISGDDALDWVRKHNQPTLAEFGGEPFEQMRSEALEVLDTDARIPYVRRRGDYLYNFWRDAANPRGLWRRTTLQSYRTAEPAWDIIIDVDELARLDDTNWVWAGADVVEPDYSLALISLSRGGSDAAIVREFDMTAREFVADGFELPEAKTQISWEDENTVLVGTDFGDDSLTESGYPRLVKRWRRGQPVDEAEMVFSAARTDVIVAASVDRTPGFERTMLRRAIDFFNDDVYELRGTELIRIDAPTDASVSVHRNWLLIELRSDWYTGSAEYVAGSLLAADYDEFLAGTAQLQVVFEPDAHTCLNHYAWTRDKLVVVTLADVASRVEIVTPGSWQGEPASGIPENTNTAIVDVDEHGDEMFLDSSGFDAPSRLLYGTAGGELAEIKRAPSFFDAADLEVSQHFATSDDGTAIPYFVVSHRHVEAPGPTLLGGYGGFEVARTPGYDGVLGRLWLARGGTYVMANIRGGGEYGPTWHTKAMREGRHLVAEDFAAVARDLVERGITTVEKLGAQGGSNGGLLMGIMLTQYPELFGALVCSVPLLDMRRFHLLLAGASWVAEYGDPDNPDDWEFISKYSPYQNISAARKYPPVLITTSTRDDRVHPGHARKMTAALEAAGHPVQYYENIEGGHGGAADNAQTAFRSALIFEFLHRSLDGCDSTSAMPTPPEFETLLYKTDGPVATITLNRPEHLNTIVPPMPDEIERAIGLAERDPAIKVIVLRGAGRAFSGGYDFGGGFRHWGDAMNTDGRWDPGKDFAMVSARETGPTQKFMAIWRASKPVIAQVHGWCVGGASDYALCADIVIASDDAVIGTPYARMWGAYLTGMWIYRLPLAKVKWHSLTGEPLTGKEAAAVELINESVPFERLEARVKEIADKLATIPLSQLQAQKLIVNQAYENMGLASTQTLGATLDGLMRNTPDALQFIDIAANQGVRTAIERRDGPWGDYSQAPPEKRPDPSHVIEP